MWTFQHFSLLRLLPIIFSDCLVVILKSVGMKKAWWTLMEVFEEQMKIKYKLKQPLLGSVWWKHRLAGGHTWSSNELIKTKAGKHYLNISAKGTQLRTIWSRQGDAGDSHEKENVVSDKKKERKLQNKTGLYYMMLYDIIWYYFILFIFTMLIPGNKMDHLVYSSC